MSRGVRQRCPLSPLLFVLAVEIVALKVRQDQLCREIELPNGQNAKISQFPDDTTLILEDTRSLRNAMSIVNSFGVLSGLRFNQKKTPKLCGSVLRAKTRPNLYNLSVRKTPSNFLEYSFLMMKLEMITIFMSE